MSFSKFREHRGGLDESLATTVRLYTYPALLKHVRGLLAPWGVRVDKLKIESYYGYDDRIGWDTYIVILEGYGVVGFTDGPVEDVPEGV
jgi:hypothetical protein